MEKRIIEKLTPYPEINKIIVFLSAGLQKALGNNLVGFYLTGSLSYDNFEPGRSDIDFLALVKNPLTEPELEGVRQVHEAGEKLSQEWAGRIECSYLPVDWLINVLPPQKPRPYWNDGVLQPACLYGSEWIINKHFLYEHGVALWGPDFKTLTKPVDIKDVQAACIRDLFKEWEPKINQPAWFDNPHYQSYLVLNLCRILCAVQGNRITTKKEAAAWVKKEYGPRWQDLVETAENWRYGMAMEKKEEAIEFIEWVVDKANKKKR